MSIATKQWGRNYPAGAAPVHGRHPKPPETIEERLKMVFGLVLGADTDELYLVTRLSSDLEADSLDYYELMIRVEDEFSIEFDAMDVTTMDFFGDWLTAVQRRVGGEARKAAGHFAASKVGFQSHALLYAAPESSQWINLLISCAVRSVLTEFCGSSFTMSRMAASSMPASIQSWQTMASITSAQSSSGSNFKQG